PIKTPGELAMERGEPWPKPVPEPAFKAAIAKATQEAEANKAAAAPPNGADGSNGAGTNGVPAGAPTQPDYGAPAGWHAPGWPPRQQPQHYPQPVQHPQGYWYPPQWQHPQAPPQPPYQPYPYPQQGQ